MFNQSFVSQAVECKHSFCIDVDKFKYQYPFFRINIKDYEKVIRDFRGFKTQGIDTQIISFESLKETLDYIP